MLERQQQLLHAAAEAQIAKLSQMQKRFETMMKEKIATKEQLISDSQLASRQFGVEFGEKIKAEILSELRNETRNDVKESLRLAADELRQASLSLDNR